MGLSYTCKMNFSHISFNTNQRMCLEAAAAENDKDTLAYTWKTNQTILMSLTNHTATVVAGNWVQISLHSLSIAECSPV